MFEECRSRILWCLSSAPSKNIKSVYIKKYDTGRLHWRGENMNSCTCWIFYFIVCSSLLTSLRLRFVKPAKTISYFPTSFTACAVPIMSQIRTFFRYRRCWKGGLLLRGKLNCSTVWLSVHGTVPSANWKQYANENTFLHNFNRRSTMFQVPFVRPYFFLVRPALQLLNGRHYQVFS